MNSCFSFLKDTVTVSTSDDEGFLPPQKTKMVYFFRFMFSKVTEVRKSECFLNVAAKAGLDG